MQKIIAPKFVLVAIIFGMTNIMIRIWATY